ncbi:GNAT family N-acetyltransferase [Hymenobacter sp.]|jgi:RimJ/RimL family protein N-acetyltransferase|uniref:GNAT family N-acetyltransferase n=1 Tax=Hymenobacter sp. TaxID=1898978 RepID=UPI002ED8100E
MTLPTIETPRLLLRPIELIDAPSILALDSDPDVLRYVPNAPLSTLAEATAIVEYIRAQYQRNGIGRWVVERKEDGAFIGWCGLKLVNETECNGRTNYYDLGYRLLTRYWGCGYASEAAEASLRYGFEVLQLPVINATVMRENRPSCRILQKLGLAKTAEFVEADEAVWYWYERANPL